MIQLCTRGSRRVRHGRSCRLVAIAWGTILIGACDPTQIPPPEQDTGSTQIDSTDNHVLGYTPKLPLTHPDAQPSGLSASTVVGGIGLTWLDNSEDEDGFLVQRSTSGNWQDLATVAGNAVNYTDTATSPGTTYCYRVLAFNGVTESVPTADACATTNPAPPAEEPPAPVAPDAPSDLTATADTTSVALTWQDNSTNEDGFIIWRSEDQTTWTNLGTVGADGTTYTDATVLAEQTYCYQISAWNTGGASVETPEQCVTMPPANTEIAGKGGGGGGGGGSKPNNGPCPVNCANSKPNRAFPTAEGFGAQALGGRGGRVLRVTTLADYDPLTEEVLPGSLRWAIEDQTGPRILVFDVGGTILLKTELTFRGQAGSFVTVAGQTAPGDGIQLGQFGLIMTDGAHDIVIRHVRIRTTFTQLIFPLSENSSRNFLRKGVLIDNWKSTSVTLNRNIIFDHCSLEWGLDDSFGADDCERVTLQWTIIGEGSLYGDSIPAGAFEGDPSFSRAGEPSQGAVFGAPAVASNEAMTVHHCLFINNKTRNMMVYTQGAVFEFINNVVYNHIAGLMIAQYYGSTASTRVNFIGNRFIDGPSRTSSYSTRPISLSEGNSVPNKESADPTPQCFYVYDNIDNYWRPNSTYSDWLVAAWLHWPGFEGYNGYLPEGYVRAYYYNPLDELYRAGKAFAGASIPVTVHPASRVEFALASSVGATLPQRDSVDTRLINELGTRTGAIGIGANQQPPRWAADGSLITRGHDPLPTLNSGPAPVDTDGDGMPDDWETSQALNPADPADGVLDPDRDGYTNVEEYLNSLAGDP